jgi:hypothetical protein
VVLLAGSAAVGLAAQALGSLAERLTVATGWSIWKPRCGNSPKNRADSRRRRRTAQHVTYCRLYRLAVEDDNPALKDDGPNTSEQAERAENAGRAERDASCRMRTRIALERPARPIWSVDRINAAGVRLKRGLHLDLPSIWIGVWLTLPGQVPTADLWQFILSTNPVGRAGRLNNLGNMLQAQFDRTGAQADLDAATEDG